MGTKATGVTFEAGTLGGIGQTIAVGRSIRVGSMGYVQDDASWTPANDGLIAYTLVPIGDIELFIGFTPEAMGFPKNHTLWGPTRHPESDYSQDGSESASSWESADSDSHFIGVAGMGSDSQPHSSDPESILPALQEDATSDAGSESTRSEERL